MFVVEAVSIGEDAGTVPSSIPLKDVKEVAFDARLTNFLIGFFFNFETFFMSAPSGLHKLSTKRSCILIYANKARTTLASQNARLSKVKSYTSLHILVLNTRGSIFLANA